MTEHITTPVTTAIAALTSDALLTFLKTQRWFAAKARAPTAAHVGDAAVAPWGDGSFALARIVVTADGAEEQYQLPLAARTTLPVAVPATAVLATVDVDGRQLSVYDAVHDADFRAGLAAAIPNGARVAGTGGTTWVFTAAGSESAAPRETTTLASGEQSNSSIIVGDRAILKLFRTLKPGVHPDAELSTFLTACEGFEHSPRVLGTITIETPDGVQAAGLMQRLVPNAVDAWQYALDRSAAYFTAPPERESPNLFLDDAKRLGAITRAMHEALASSEDDPEFAPEPAGHEDLDRWAHRAQHTVRSSLALLERQLSTPDFPKQRVPEAQALVRRAEHYAGWIDEIDDQLDDDLGLCTRVHGDFHLGQVLRTGDDDFMIIDFEGEPSKSLDERREKTSPLRDVAGMLRSFGYAAAALSARTHDPQTRELRAARWERDVRAAFLSGYLGAPVDRDDDPGVLPEEEAHVKDLIALFEMEKAFYELAYELNNRPDWAWIPMRGISRLAFR